MMTLPDPTIVFRTRSYSAADSLVAFLLAAGVNARLVAPVNEYSQVHAGEGPVFGAVYDVCAAGCTQDDVQDLMITWQEEQTLVSASAEWFCFYCGEVLQHSVVTCPYCGKSL
ncbi:hypothetical protein FHS27_004947 [Rhodopirellula rubra]|uniref:DUF2007 domain-containing protein n=1 Tax=Aporhodopirellula rubra TaxID=980271 RepID=A0A7W5E2P2_9BACT|nr:hypothetical protein [Aporhodopirellula rubra]MBB3209111.1 hypothetical protein [Aporhodopirellula rubra]